MAQWEAPSWRPAVCRKFSSGLGLNFLLASASFTHSHTLCLDSYCRPTVGKSSSPAGKSTLVYAYVVDCACAPSSPYVYCCLSASPACVCGRGAATWGCPRRCLPCLCDSPAPLNRTSGGWLWFGWLWCRQQTASTRSRCDGGVAACLCQPGARSGLPCPVPSHPPAAAAAAWRGRGLVPIAGWSYVGVGPERGLRGGGRRQRCEEWARRG